MERSLFLQIINKLNEKLEDNPNDYIQYLRYIIAQNKLLISSYFILFMRTIYSNWHQFNENQQDEILDILSSNISNNFIIILRFYLQDENFLNKILLKNISNITKETFHKIIVNPNLNEYFKKWIKTSDVSIHEFIFPKFIDYAISYHNFEWLELLKKINPEVFNNIIKQFPLDKKQNLYQILLRKSQIVSKYAKEFLEGFGNITYNGGLLTCAQIAQNKAYFFDPIILKDDKEFEDFIQFIKSNKEYFKNKSLKFAVSGMHWISGMIEFDKTGKMEILFMDSLGNEFDDERYQLFLMPNDSNESMKMEAGQIYLQKKNNKIYYLGLDLKGEKIEGYLDITIAEDLTLALLSVKKKEILSYLGNEGKISYALSCFVQDKVEIIKNNIDDKDVVIYCPSEIRQNSGSGCSVFALDDLRRFYTVNSKYNLPKQYSSLLDFFRKNSTKVTRTLHDIPITIFDCKLPIPFKKTKQTSKLISEIENDQEFNKLPNKHGVTPLDSIAKSFQYLKGKKMNRKLEKKLNNNAKKNLRFLYSHNDQYIEEAMAYFSFSGFKRKIENEKKLASKKTTIRKYYDDNKAKITIKPLQQLKQPKIKKGLSLLSKIQRRNDTI